MGGRAGGKGGGGKSKASGQAAVKTTTKKMQTGVDHRLVIRNALWHDDGSVRDPTDGFGAFLAYNRNGLEAEIGFSSKLTRRERERCHAIAAQALEGVDEGWDAADKMAELSEQASRFLLFRAPAEDGNGRIIGFAMFRFTVEGDFVDEVCGEPCLQLLDLHVEPGEARRKGLAKHALNLLQLVARKFKLGVVQIAVPPGCDAAVALAFGAGFERDLLEYAPDGVTDECTPPTPPPRRARAHAAPQTSTGCSSSKRRTRRARRAA